MVDFRHPSSWLQVNDAQDGTLSSQAIQLLDERDRAVEDAISSLGSSVPGGGGDADSLAGGSATVAVTLIPLRQDGPTLVFVVEGATGATLIEASLTGTYGDVPFVFPVNGAGDSLYIVRLPALAEFTEPFTYTASVTATGATAGTITMYAVG